MQEEGTGPGSLIENSSLLAQGGETDFLHLPGLGCTLRYLHQKHPQAISKGRNQVWGCAKAEGKYNLLQKLQGCICLCTTTLLPLGLVSKTSKEPALKSHLQKCNSHLSIESPALLGAEG